jgi:hypothetical protein
MSAPVASPTPPTSGSLAAWAALVVVLPALTVAWLSRSIPPNPLLDVQWPVVGVEAADATDLPGPRSRRALREAEDHLVVTLGPGGAPRGYDLRITAGATEAALVDTTGRVLHRWTATRSSFGSPIAGSPWFGAFRAAVLRPDGGLYVLVDGVGLVAVDRAGTLEWARTRSIHDHLELLPNGHVRILAEELRQLFDVERTQIYPIEQVLEFDASGKEVGKLDLARAYSRAGLDWKPKKGAKDSSFGAVWLETAPDGTVGVALRRRGALAVLDPEHDTLHREERGAWGNTGPFTRSPDGGLTLLDSGPDQPIRVVTVDPAGNVVRALEVPLRWDVLAPGTLQRLPDGHLLVTGGNVLELDADGAVVWSVDSPDTPPLSLVQNRRYPDDCCAWLAEVAP